MKHSMTICMLAVALLAAPAAGAASRHHHPSASALHAYASARAYPTSGYAKGAPHAVVEPDGGLIQDRDEHESVGLAPENLMRGPGR